MYWIITRMTIIFDSPHISIAQYGKGNYVLLSAPWHTPMCFSYTSLQQGMKLHARINLFTQVYRYIVWTT